MTQDWLDDVALSSFRSVPGATASLETWFADPKVTLYLKVSHIPLAPRLV